MKKITLLLLFAVSTTSLAQQKSTGDVTLSNNMTVNISLDNNAQKAIMKLIGPSDRWFAVQFGSFTENDGMKSGEDLVYANATTMIDANHDGVGATPNIDAAQNWTVTSNTVTSGIRTVLAERSLSTGDANDYTFDFSNSTIDLVWARRSNAGYTLNNHGGANRGYVMNVPLATLGVEDFSLNASSVYPNPSNGIFTIETKTGLDKINVYSQTGSLIKTIEISDPSNTIEVNLKNLQKGVYLLELLNENEKSWKKIIIE